MNAIRPDVQGVSRNRYYRVYSYATRVRDSNRRPCKISTYRPQYVTLIIRSNTLTDARCTVVLRPTDAQPTFSTSLQHVVDPRSQTRRIVA